MNIEVVVVTFNSAEELPALFTALDGKTAVTVVDNASSDNSAAVAESFGAHVIQGEVNAGFGAGCNRGAREGDADYLLFLNPDARISPDNIQMLVELFDQFPHLAAGSPQIHVSDGRPQRVAWPFPSVRGAWLEAFGLQRLLRNQRADFVVGACFFVRRSAFEEVHGFDTRIWLYGEETDLCRRLSDAGGTIVLDPEAHASHIGGASGMSMKELVTEHFTRGGEHFVAKHEGSRALVSYRLARVAGSAVRAGLRRGAKVDYHRWRLARTARLLLTHPASVPLDSPATRAPGKGLVVCSLESWDEVWRRNQYFVRELLVADPDLRVLFIEPSFDVRHEARMGSARVRKRGLRPLLNDGRITLFEPLKLLPRRLGPPSDRHRDRQVLNAVKQLSFNEPTLWVNDASYASLAEQVSWPSVYDITDDWTLTGDAHVAAAAARDEPRLYACCDRIVVCSQSLLDSRRPLRPDTVLVPNGVDTDALRRLQPRPADLPEGDTAVYVGTISANRVDLALVDQLARSIPTLAVVLVGPALISDASRAQLDTIPNISILGPRPHDQVPGYLQHASLLIVPHIVSPFTDSLDPIKLYECQALGHPTVATPVAGFRNAGPPIVVAERDHFVEAVGRVLADPPPNRPQQSASWTDRAADFAKVLLDARSTRRTRRLRVVYFDHCARLSGGELALARLLPAMSDIDATVILGEHGRLEGVLADRGIDHEVLELDSELANTHRSAVTLGGLNLHTLVATVQAIRALRRRLIELQPDLLHTNSLKANLLGGVAGRLAGVPVVWHVRDRIAADYLTRPAVLMVQAASRVLPTRLIANSFSTRSTLGPRLKTEVIASAVAYDLVEFVDTSDTTDSDSPLLFVMVGRLAAWKGQDVFLDAFAKAFPDGQERAIIAGTAMFDEGEFGHSLHSQAARLGISDRVDFVGFVNNVPKLLSTADVLVHASVIAEPFGQVVIEGMAAGLAVIASSIGGPAEIITDGVNGLLCAPGNTDALASILQRLAANPEERARLGARAYRRASDFRPEIIADQVMGVYRELL